MAAMNRRRFMVKAAGATASVTLTTLKRASLYAADRKLGTCGPPPRKNPERQTSAESI